MLDTPFQEPTQAVTIASAVVKIAGVWLALGVLFAVAFSTVGLARVDPRAHGASFGFRALIFPATVALWPLLLVRWIRGGGEPVERNSHRAHRQAARENDA